MRENTTDPIIRDIAPTEDRRTIIHTETAQWDPRNSRRDVTQTTISATIADLGATGQTHAQKRNNKQRKRKQRINNRFDKQMR